ncbi:MAG: alpha/beta fold hydrolase [Candidatus Sumerlaeota bacterium]|nr:alpha/beta fold hydrolase [Candidatus Sumerlaeota bacterium]
MGVVTGVFLVGQIFAAEPASRPGPATTPASAPLEGWESLPDGTQGQAMDFQGAGGVAIAGYLRKPAGPGPFPVVVMLHGGGPNKQATYKLAQVAALPTTEFIANGWALYSIDFRPNPPAIMDPLEWDDVAAAIAKARALPFIDPDRVALVGGSHGGNVVSHMASRVDARCGVMCAPALLDLLEVAKVIAEGKEAVNPALPRAVADLEQKDGAKIDEIAKNPERYHYLSAFNEVDKVRFPLLIINGRKDDASPIPIIDAYVKKLQAAGKEVETFYAENGPHNFYFGSATNPETQEACKRMVAFIGKHFNAK